MNEMQAMLDYLRALEQNNDREWFHAHHDQYKQAAAAFEQLVDALSAELAAHDPAILPRPAKELTFKLNRDTRFSRDKSPYNPAFRAHIGPKGKLPVPVGYYLTIRPGGSFLGGGLFADMFKDATEMVRRAIAEDGQGFEKILSDPAFAQNFTLGGSALKKVPAGYDAAHPQAAYLKQKSWYVEYPLTDQEVADKDFLARAADLFLKMRPFNDFLNHALADFQMPAR